MLTVACVLNTPSPTYNAEWVRRLQAGVSKHLSVPHRFVCLTNNPEIDGIQTKPLTDNLPAWWAKIELFKPGQFEGPVLYLDLDTMICGSIDELAGPWNGLVMLKDSPLYQHVYGSGIMWFDPTQNPELENIYNRFMSNPEGTMEEYSGKNGAEMNGDQGVIYQTMKQSGQEVLRWQEILPSQWFLEFSYNRNLNPVVADDTYDRDARVCYPFGYPKFSNMPWVPIVQRHWKAV
ncbi:MAG TPA: hypothetical protein VNU47_01500 [Candidatus Paceibacterota bacterium]|nr:hypothetical protein [Candidatus Paceibacterota bacterium]